MASITDYVQDVCLRQINNLNELSVLLNEVLEEYERIENANIYVSNVGFRVDPIKYKAQQKLQLFDIVPLND